MPLNKIIVILIYKSFISQLIHLFPQTAQSNELLLMSYKIFKAIKFLSLGICNSHISNLTNQV